MKRIIILLTITLVFAAFAQEEALPYKAQRAKERFERQKERLQEEYDRKLEREKELLDREYSPETEKVNEAYIAELDELKSEYMKDEDLAAAIAVDALLKEAKEAIGKSDEGKKKNAMKKYEKSVAMFEGTWLVTYHGRHELYRTIIIEEDGRITARDAFRKGGERAWSGGRLNTYLVYDEQNEVFSTIEAGKIRETYELDGDQLKVFRWNDVSKFPSQSMADNRGAGERVE